MEKVLAIGVLSAILTLARFLLADRPLSEDLVWIPFAALGWSFVLVWLSLLVVARRREWRTAATMSSSDLGSAAVHRRARVQCFAALAGAILWVTLGAMAASGGLAGGRQHEPDYTIAVAPFAGPTKELYQLASQLVQVLDDELEDSRYTFRVVRLREPCGDEFAAAEAGQRSAAGMVLWGWWTEISGVATLRSAVTLSEGGSGEPRTLVAEYQYAPGDRSSLEVSAEVVSLARTMACLVKAKRYLADNRGQDALAILMKRASATDGDMPPALRASLEFHIGLAHELAGDSQEALFAFRMCLSNSGGWVAEAALLEAAKILCATGQPDTALAILGEVADRLERPCAAIRAVGLQFAQGRSLGQLERTLALLETRCSPSPEDGVLLATLSLGRGDARVAVELLDLCVQNGIGGVYALLLQAEAYEQLGQDEKVRGLLSQASRAEPGNPAVLYARAGFLMRNGEFEDALADFRRILVDRPMEADTLVMAGTCLLALDRPSESGEYFERAMLARPGDYSTPLVWGLCHMERADYPAAVAKLTIAIQDDPDRVDAYFYRAQCYGYMGNNQLAAADLAQLNSLLRDAAPPNAEALDILDEMDRMVENLRQGFPPSGSE
jgi:tetratricopeptide (TPR) repeat protein